MAQKHKGKLKSYPPEPLKPSLGKQPLMPSSTTSSATAPAGSVGQPEEKIAPKVLSPDTRGSPSSSCLRIVTVPNVVENVKVQISPALLEKDAGSLGYSSSLNLGSAVEAGASSHGGTKGNQKIPGVSGTTCPRMTERFDCHHCKESLYGNKYILREEDPYCVKCYESLFSNICDECKQPIGSDAKDLSYKDRHWHESCFHCFQCQSSLVDKPFAAKDDHLLCTDCYSNEYSAKCGECKKNIVPGTRKMEYKGSSWHETCFICSRCQQPIGTKSFIPKDDQNFCVPCYEKQFAMQCVQCKKPITTGGVTYRDEPWHKECFICTGCKQQLSGQRFTSRDEFPYCITCFSNLYSKKCAGCSEPISGLGGSKYISFEERQWHNECFNCKKCSISLVGRGFLTDRDDILCPECGKDI